MNTKLLSFFALLLLGACCTAPEIVPSVSQDSVIMMSLKEQIKDNNKIETGWGWIAWYFPVLLLVGAWTWRELIKKPFVCETCEFEKSKIVAAAKKAERIAKEEDKKSTANTEIETKSNNKLTEPKVPQ